MEHLLLKAATTATDQGTFTAVISTASVDRAKDIIEPAAMVASLAKWAALGKLVPLAWNHTDEVVGHIDPSTAEIVNGEVVAKGYVDHEPRPEQPDYHGPQAWRLVKSGTLSFSFGFLFDPNKDVTKLANGRYRVKNLDVFEISVIPVGPANNDTRVLSWKSAEDRDNVIQQLQDVTDRLEKLEKALKDVQEAGTATQEPPARVADPLATKARAVVMDLLAEGSKPPARVTQEQPPGPDIEPEELKRRSRDLIVSLLSD
jgi:HK97 family phage prohead protease